MIAFVFFFPGVDFKFSNEADTVLLPSTGMNTYSFTLQLGLLCKIYKKLYL